MIDHFYSLALIDHFYTLALINHFYTLALIDHFYTLALVTFKGRLRERRLGWKLYCSLKRVHIFTLSEIQLTSGIQSLTDFSNADNSDGDNLDLLDISDKKEGP